MKINELAYEFLIKNRIIDFKIKIVENFIYSKNIKISFFYKFKNYFIYILLILLIVFCFKYVDAYNIDNNQFNTSQVFYITPKEKNII